MSEVIENKSEAPHHPNSQSKRLPSEKQKKLADGVIKEGKSFRQAALAAGYSQNSADTGPKFMRRSSLGIDMAFVQASRELTWQPEEVKAIIRNRLLSDLSRGKSSGLAREAELLGRDKTIDMFVRSGDVQIGIFGTIGENSGSLEALTVTASESEPDPK